jgi:hypothetical protein
LCKDEGILLVLQYHFDGIFADFSLFMLLSDARTIFGENFTESAGKIRTKAFAPLVFARKAVFLSVGKPMASTTNFAVSLSSGRYCMPFSTSGMFLPCK